MSLNLIVLIAFIFAFLIAEIKGKLFLATFMAFLFLLPSLFQISAIGWMCYTGKVILGIGCYLYIKSHGFL